MKKEKATQAAKTKKAFMISLHAMLWRSAIIPEIIWCWQPDGMCMALSEWWQRGHWRLRQGKGTVPGRK